MTVKSVYVAEVGMGTIKWVTPPGESIDRPWVCLNDLVLAGDWGHKVYTYLTRSGGGAILTKRHGWIISHSQAKEACKAGIARDMEGARYVYKEFKIAARAAVVAYAGMLDVSTEDLWISIKGEPECV